MAKDDFPVKFHARVNQFITRYVRMGRAGREAAEDDIYALIEAGAALLARTATTFEEVKEVLPPKPKKKAQPREHKKTSANIELKVANEEPPVVENKNVGSNDSLNLSDRRDGTAES